MNKLFTYLILLFISLSFCSISDAALKVKSIADLKKSLLNKKEIFIEKGSGVDSKVYRKVLENLDNTTEDFKISNAIVYIGKKFSFDPVISTDTFGPEYSNDMLLAPYFDVEIDGYSSLNDVVSFLKNLPVEEALIKFVKKNYIDSDDYIKKYGLDFYLVSLMSSMIQYQEYEKFLIECATALGKEADVRVIAFLEDYLKQYNPPAEAFVEIEKLKKGLIEKFLEKEIFGRPLDCSLLKDLAYSVTNSNDEEEVKLAFDNLSRLDCKEASAFLFFIYNLSYVRKGESLFDKNEYFDWDSENYRFAFDLKRRDTFAEEINAAYIEHLRANGISLTEALSLLSKKENIFIVDANSLYFEYLFKIPYSENWKLTKNELRSLIENSLMAGPGYTIERMKKFHKVVKIK